MFLAGRKTNRKAPNSLALITTVEEGQPGIDGGMIKRPNLAAVGANIIDVPSVDEYTNKIVSSGGSVLMPKMSIRGLGQPRILKTPKPTSLA
jgi:predicted enzyme related to lactoylglutathione lyase